MGIQEARHSDCRRSGTGHSSFPDHDGMNRALRAFVRGTRMDTATSFPGFGLAQKLIVEASSLITSLFKGGSAQKNSQRRENFPILICALQS
jgi:hypothetical protein